jgi:hypothetical protein
MRNRKIITAKAAVLAASLAFILTAPADKLVAPPEPQDLVGEWFGYDQDLLRFCRLELYSEGKGLFCMTFVNDPPELYLIEKWSLTGNALDLDLKPLDLGAEAIFLKGAAGRHELALEIGGLGTKWKRKLSLFNGSEFQSRLQKTKDRMAKYKQEKK